MNASKKALGVFFLSIFVLVTLACSCNSITSQISGLAATPTSALNLKGVHIRIVYIQQREADAQKAADRLRHLGASVETYLTSDSGNADFVNHVYYESGYEQSAVIIASEVSDIESVTPSVITDANPNPGLQIYLWIAEPK